MNEKKQKKSGFRSPWVWIVMVVAAIVFAVSIDDSSYTPPPVSDSNLINQKQEVVTSQGKESYAFKLASLDEGKPDPSEVGIAAFENILADLQRKCPNESEEEIANYIFKGNEILEEKGKDVSIFEFGNAMSESIPEDVDFIQCSEIAASLVVLMSDDNL